MTQPTKLWDNLSQRPGLGRLPNKHFRRPGGLRKYQVWPHLNCLPKRASPFPRTPVISFLQQTIPRCKRKHRGIAANIHNDKLNRWRDNIWAYINLTSIGNHNCYRKHIFAWIIVPLVIALVFSNCFCNTFQAEPVQAGIRFRRNQTAPGLLWRCITAIA